MLGNNIDDFVHYEFMDPPTPNAVHNALKDLLRLQLIETKTFNLSNIGIESANLSIAPRHGKILMEAAKLDCLTDCIILVSFLSIQNKSFWLHHDDYEGEEDIDNSNEINISRQKFDKSKNSDLLILLELYKEYNSGRQ
jgi:ATP-dependent helicase HrpA